MIQPATMVAGGLMLCLLGGAIALDLTHNPMKRSRQFRVRRLWNWLATGMLYACFYFGRYNMSIINTDATRAFLGVTKVEYGVILTAGFWTYGLSQITAGMLADKIGGRGSIVLGAMGTMTINVVNGLLFFTSSHAWGSLLFLNMLNQLFQPYGSISTLKINSGWYHKKERGVFSGTFGVMISFGYFFALVVGSVIVRDASLPFVFWSPATLLAACSVLVLLVVKDMPHQAGLSIERERAPIGSKRVVASKSTAATRLLEALSIPTVLVATSAMFCVGWLREGFLSWQVSFFEEAAGVPVGSTLSVIANSCVSVGGLCGSVVGGYLSDKCFNSKRAPVVMVYFVIEAIVLVALYIIRVPELMVVLAGLLAFCLFGALTLLMASASTDFAGHRLAGTTSAVMNMGQYIGSGVAASVTGWVVQEFSWGGWVLALLPACVVGFVLMVILRRMQGLVDKTEDEVARARAKTLQAVMELSTPTKGEKGALWTVNPAGSDVEASPGKPARSAAVLAEPPAP